MKHLLIAASCAAAACGIAVPAFAGLSGNASFSHSVPVRVPSHATVVKFDDRGREVEPGDDRGGPTSTTTPSAPRTSEPGDDRSGSDRGPGSDDGTPSPSETEPGDDRGTSTAPGDDSASSTESGDGGGHDGGSGSSGSGGSGSSGGDGGSDG